MRITSLYVASLLLCVTGCSVTGRMAGRQSGPDVRLLRRVELPDPAAGICSDGDGTLLLDAAGVRLIRYDSLLVSSETLPVSPRVLSPRGCAADRFYYYVYDDRSLYRMRRSGETLAVWLGNVRVVGLAPVSVGEMLVADEERQAVFHKTVFGSSRRFLQASDITRPGPIVALPGGRFAAISGRNRLTYFDRSGIVTGSVSLPASCDLMVADESGTLLLGMTGRPAVWRVANGRADGFALPGGTSPTGLAVAAGGFVILDSGLRLIRFALPSSD